MNNNEAGSSTAVPPISTPAIDEHAVTSDGLLSTAPGSRRTARAYEQVRISHLDEVIQTLDYLVWVQLAVVYYMDNSFLRLALRGLMQIVHLAPRPALLKPNPLQTPYTLAILMANIFCMTLHLYLSPPQAGEATRGYLHGSLLLDFVGQHGPSSKIHLLLLDALVLMLQLTAVAAVLKRADLSAKNSNPVRTSPSNSSRQPEISVAAASSQDHDAEERGEHNRQPLPLDSMPLETRTGNLYDLEPGTDAGEAQHWILQDLTASGQVVIAELFLWDIICDQYKTYIAFTQSPGYADALRSNLSELSIPFRT